MNETPNFRSGGYIPTEGVPVYIHPDECVLRPEGGRWVCVRPDHDHKPHDNAEEPA